MVKLADSGNDFFQVAMKVTPSPTSDRFPVAARKHGESSGFAMNVWCQYSDTIGVMVDGSEQE
jgi:hypothetical protein